MYVVMWKDDKRFEERIENWSNLDLSTGDYGLKGERKEESESIRFLSV